MNIDLLLSGGMVVDGTGAPGYRADVAIKDGKIKEVGRIAPPQDVPVVDATGLVVAPGFIDIHSHSDFTLTVDPRAQSAINQGVTLEVVGNCGHGCAPFTDAALVRTNLYGYVPGFSFPWKSVGEYLSYLESRKPAVNVATLVPNGNLRLAVLGLVSRSSTRDEIKNMKRLLEQGLDEGALGYSSGLEYPIEQDCSEEEVIELCRLAKRAGRYYATHTRNRLGQPEESIAEAIRTARAADVPLQISHITVICRLTERSRWAVERGLEQVDEARQGGLDVGFDVHTRAFGTTNLSAVLPSWALAGGTAAIAQRLKSPSVRKEMEQYPSIVSALARGDWDKIVVFDSKIQPEISRRSIADISQERGTPIFDTIYDLLLTEIEDMNSLMICAFNYRAEDLQLAFTHPDCMVGSDAVALATDGPLREQTLHGSYTWASWFFRHFVRERKLLPVEEAVRRLSSLPASRLQLHDRGIVRKGVWADLAVFDPALFADRGTVFEPNQLAVGMKHVLVNGVLTLHNSVPTGKHGGQVLRAN